MYNVDCIVQPLTPCKESVFTREYLFLKWYAFIGTLLPGRWYIIPFVPRFDAFNAYNLPIPLVHRDKYSLHEVPVNTDDDV